MLLSIAVKSRWGLKVLKSWGNWLWMLPNLTGVFVGFTLLALTRKAVPEVKKTAPRGELALKKLAGRSFGSAKASGTASQLISRRPSGNVPPTPLLGPRKARKASTAAWISAGLAPDASNTTGAATAVLDNDRITAAKAIATRFMMCSPFDNASVCLVDRIRICWLWIFFSS